MEILSTVFFIFFSIPKLCIVSSNTFQNLSNQSVPLENVRVVIQTESRNVPRVNVHESARQGVLEAGEFETIYFKIDCRHPEEISMLCNVTYSKSGQHELSFKRKYLLPVSIQIELPRSDFGHLKRYSGYSKYREFQKLSRQCIWVRIVDFENPENFRHFITNLESFQL